MTSDASTGPAFAAGARTTLSQPLALATFRDTPWSVRING